MSLSNPVKTSVILPLHGAKVNAALASYLMFKLLFLLTIYLCSSYLKNSILKRVTTKLTYLKLADEMEFTQTAFNMKIFERC